eukprot:3876490-Rhodomonas_salina.4
MNGVQLITVTVTVTVAAAFTVTVIPLGIAQAERGAHLCARDSDGRVPETIAHCQTMRYVRNGHGMGR